MMTSSAGEEGWGWGDTGPVWGARAFAPKSGQDHLGLGSVSSDRLLPSLSPGINVLTIHPRYWSFYSWVLDDFWSTDLSRTRNAFRTFYRPREAIFSMSCHVCDAPEHATLVANIVGSRRIRPEAQEPNFDPQFDYIKESLGGYGLYYRSTMELTGALILAGPASGFPFDAPTPIGRALAAAFREAVAGTRIAVMLANGDTTSPIARDALNEFARKACLCQLRNAEGHDLPLLRDLFLHSGTAQEVGARSETLRMFLDLSGRQQDRQIGQDEFRQLIYFRELNTSRYTPRADLLNVARRWRVYQGREYFAYVFNRLLRWISRRGLNATDGGLTPLPEIDLWEIVSQSLDDNADVDMAVGLPEINSSTPVADFLAYLTNEADIDAKADQVWHRRNDLDEHALYRSCQERDEDDGQTLLALLAIVLLLRERFGLPKRSLEYADEQWLVAEGGSLRIGMARFMHLLNRRMLLNPNIIGLARWLIEDFVIVQHERVAAAKLPDDTYRIRRVGDSLRFFAQEVPAEFNDSRFNALSTTVHELGWVSTFREPNRRLTKSGRALLGDGDLPPGVLEAAAAVFDADEDTLT